VREESSEPGASVIAEPLAHGAEYVRKRAPLTSTSPHLVVSSQLPELRPDLGEALVTTLSAIQYNARRHGCHGVKGSSTVSLAPQPAAKSPVQSATHPAVTGSVNNIPARQSLRTSPVAMAEAIASESKRHSESTSIVALPQRSEPAFCLVVLRHKLVTEGPRLECRVRLAANGDKCDAPFHECSIPTDIFSKPVRTDTTTAVEQSQVACTRTVYFNSGGCVRNPVSLADTAYYLCQSVKQRYAATTALDHQQGDSSRISVWLQEHTPGHRGAPIDDSTQPGREGTTRPRLRPMARTLGPTSSRCRVVRVLRTLSRKTIGGNLRKQRESSSTSAPTREPQRANNGAGVFLTLRPMTGVWQHLCRTADVIPRRCGTRMRRCINW
jgi:hypothetical protein